MTDAFAPADSERPAAANADAETSACRLEKQKLGLEVMSPLVGEGADLLQPNGRLGLGSRASKRAIAIFENGRDQIENVPGDGLGECKRIPSGRGLGARHSDSMHMRERWETLAAQSAAWNGRKTAGGSRIVRVFRRSSVFGDRVPSQEVASP